MSCFATSRKTAAACCSAGFQLALPQAYSNLAASMNSSGMCGRRESGARPGSNRAGRQSHAPRPGGHQPRPPTVPRAAPRRAQPRPPTVPHHAPHPRRAPTIAADTATPRVSPHRRQCQNHATPPRVSHHNHRQCHAPRLRARLAMGTPPDSPSRPAPTSSRAMHRPPDADVTAPHASSRRIISRGFSSIPPQTCRPLRLQSVQSRGRIPAWPTPDIATCWFRAE